MNCVVENYWRACKPHEIAAGEIFTSLIGEVGVIAIMASSAGEQPFAFVLGTRGTDEDFETHPAPASRSLSTLNQICYRYVGPALHLRPTLPDAGRVVAPLPPQQGEHGDLVLVGNDSTPFVLADDFPMRRRVRTFVNLLTGECVFSVEGPAVILKKWEMVSVIAEGRELRML